MSLQVWLPLNGDLNNQGLSNVTASNNGAVIDSNGKIGSCYKFGTGDSKITLSTNSFTGLTGDFSVACWVKITSWNTSYATIWAATSTSTAWNQIMAGLFRDQSTSRILFCIGNNSASTRTYCKTVNDVELNTWNHFVCTYTSGKIRLYQNGNLESEYVTDIIPSMSAVQAVDIGKMRTAYQSNCHVNDFRIYNHCLSEREIKELARGLVLHYPLSKPCDNLLTNGYYVGNATGSDLTITPFTYNGIKGYRCTKTMNASWGSYLNVRLKNVLSLDINKKYSLSFYVAPLGDNKQAHVTNFVASGGSDNIFINKQDIPFPSSGQLIKFENMTPSSSFSTTASISTFGWHFDIVKDADFFVSMVKFEEGEKCTPWIPHKEDAAYFAQGFNKEFDISGYSNNGDINNISSTSNTPRYSSSYSFIRANSSHIKIKNPLMNGQQELTINLWATSEDWWSFGRLFSCTEDGGYNVEYANNQMKFAVNVYTNSSQTSWAYNSSVSSGSAYIGINPNDISSGWHMFTFIYSASDGFYIYLDGKQYSNCVVQTYGIRYSPIDNLPLFIGCEAGYNGEPATPFFNGKISDFRIYSTALSASDVQELYQGGSL